MTLDDTKAAGIKTAQTEPPTGGWSGRTHVRDGLVAPLGLLTITHVPSLNQTSGSTHTIR